MEGNGPHIKVRPAGTTSRVLSEAVDGLYVISVDCRYKGRYPYTTVRNGFISLLSSDTCRLCKVIVVSTAKTVSSYREIFHQEDWAQVVVKICHLSGNQMKLPMKVLSHTWITISPSYEGRVEGFWVGWTISAPVTPSVYCVETGMT